MFVRITYTMIIHYVYLALHIQEASRQTSQKIEGRAEKNQRQVEHLGPKKKLELMRNIGIHSLPNIGMMQTSSINFSISVVSNTVSFKQLTHSAIK